MRLPITIYLVDFSKFAKNFALNGNELFADIPTKALLQTRMVLYFGWRATRNIWHRKEHAIIQRIPSKNAEICRM